MHGSEEDYQTPSPADRAADNIEQVIRETRDTLEQNEQVFFGVYKKAENMWQRFQEDKGKTISVSHFLSGSFWWESIIFHNKFFKSDNQISLIQGKYKTQLKTHRMKASKMEADLANQTYQVQYSFVRWCWAPILSFLFSPL